MNNLTILFVEDEKIVHTLLKKYVKEYSLDYEFIDEYTVEGALKVVKEKRIDLIISDFYLTDGNAYDILDKISDIPLILITGSGSEELAVNSLKLGFFDYVVKDIGDKFFKKLFQSIENAIDKGKYEIQLKKFINISNLMIFSLDENFNINYVNNQVGKKFGKDLNDLIGNNFINTFVEEYEKVNVLKIFKQILLDSQTGNGANNGNIEIELKIGNKNIPMRFSYTSFKDSLKGSYMILLSGEDISNQKEIIRLKNEFLSMMSHEIRNPITVVSGLVELMLTKELDQTIMKKYLVIIKKEFKRLEELTNDYLNYQRLETGRENFNLEEINIKNLIDEVYILYKDGYNCNIELSGAFDEKCIVNADYNKIKQVLLNLISNSIKYAKDDLKIILDVKKSGSFVEISVIDNGLGIPEEDLPNLFEKYYRINKKAYIKKDGSGLGLAICKKIIEAHNGEIIVTSVYNKGSNFTIKIPIVIGK